MLILRLLTNWGRVTHIRVGNLTITGSDNGLSSSRHQAIILANAEILLIWPLGTNFSEVLIVQEKAYGNIVWKMGAILSWPLCVKQFMRFLSFPCLCHCVNCAQKRIYCDAATRIGDLNEGISEISATNQLSLREIESVLKAIQWCPMHKYTAMKLVSTKSLYHMIYIYI